MARRAWLGGIAAASCLIVAGIAGPTGSALAQSGEPLPAPVVAPVAAPADAPLAVTAIYRDPDVQAAEPVFIVALTSPLTELPDGSRVSLLTGDPAGLQRRASLILEEGAARGDIDEGTADAFEFVQPAEVAITDDGLARIRLDGMADSDLLWAETATVDGAVTVSPVFPFSQVSGASGPGALTPALAATVVSADNVPTGEVVPLDAVPTLEVVNQAITVRTTQPVPTEVAGTPVTRVRDFLRIVPDFSAGGQAPYFVVIDHTDGTVTYFDGTGGIPVEVTVPESDWLVDGLEATETETASVTFDRAGLLGAVGIPEDGNAALGVARAVVLDDGRYLTAEGPVGTLTWFDESVGGTVTPPSTDLTTSTLAPTTVAAAEAEDDSGPNPAVLIAAVLVAAGLGGAALLSARRNRRALAEPETALGAMAKVVGSTAQGADEDADAPEQQPIPSRPPSRTSLRVPGSGGRPPADPAVAGAVGAAGARAVVSREAQARAAAERAIAEEEAATAAGETGDEGREALWAAMRRKAAEASEVGDASEAGDAGDPDDAPEAGDAAEADAAEPGVAPPASPDDGVDAEPLVPKTTRPDDALDALNRLIDDLPLPDDQG